MKPVVDLDRRHFTAVRGDITVIGTWYLTEDDWRPALVFIRTNEEKSDHTIPAGITVDKAYIFSDVPGIGDGARAARMAFHIAKCLRMEGDPRNVIRIGMLINNFLSDLMHIPPWTPVAKLVVGEAKVTEVESGKTIESEISEHV